jgi:hypothetical protein
MSDRRIELDRVLHICDHDLVRPMRVFPNRYEGMRVMVQCKCCERRTWLPERVARNRGLLSADEEVV